MFEKIITQLKAKFGAQIILKEEIEGLQPACYIDPSKLVEVCEYLHGEPTLYFDFLANITAVDQGAAAAAYTLVYHLTSMPHKLQLVLKINLPYELDQETLPTVPSVHTIWRTADWHEREAFDLMGIFFTGHPDLRRILLPDDWEGYPLRKDYQEAALYHGIPIK
ncbi:NADH-quinone oxidoreductase subunit C [Sphingobacteriaceae bacterium WQ 2009]|uniref:NADH-quinone oxidoreductase subunit C n=1 Tax=Rhinopithecimicrobium faecis TaxID=2820698 RepID=A0A8T4HC75_9SPHI|nr:NADH-quinone oxidoreductase subunit C [Sphingobacteriaceae bacterium WQ 2009]